MKNHKLHTKLNPLYISIANAASNPRENALKDQNTGTLIKLK